jgi:CLIP-associating protein 1/2
VVDDALRAQANQAISAAQQLLDFEEPSPSTPARASLFPQRNGSDLLRTPVNGIKNGNAWEDSPRNQAVTPMFLEKLKGRRYERSWWARQQQCRFAISP